MPKLLGKIVRKILEKLSNPEVAPFIPQIPDGIKEETFCDTYLKDMLQFDLRILCATRSGLKDFIR